MIRRSIQAARCIVLLGALLLPAACAPSRTGETYRANEINQPAIVSTGTILSMRTVDVQGSSGGLGTAGGAAVGGVAGSFIGGDWRSQLLAGIGGAVIGGLAGNAAERAATSGQATEFVIREEGGQTIAVVQTNEENMRVGDRVTVLRGQRTRIVPARG